MRKLLLTTVAVAAAIGLAVAGEPSFGTFTDTRDGQTYKTVKIGTQTWMAQNLNYQTQNGSWCYKDSTSYCKKYGRLYDWKTAKTVCPAGFHLPSYKKWYDLVANIGGNTAGNKLKARSGWSNNGNGTDDFGFSALPGGGRSSDGDFGGAGDFGGWWAASELSDGRAYYRNMYYNRDYVGGNRNYKSYGFSVRCVQN